MLICTAWMRMDTVQKECLLSNKQLSGERSLLQHDVPDLLCLMCFSVIVAVSTAAFLAVFLEFVAVI